MIMEGFGLSDSSGRLWAEFTRDHTGKIRLLVKPEFAKLPQDHRLYACEAQDGKLTLNPTGDDRRSYIQCSNSQEEIRINLDYDRKSGDILVAQPSTVRLRYFAASPDYFRLVIND